MFKIENLTGFPVAYYGDPDGERHDVVCFCLKTKLRLVDGQVPVIDEALEQDQPAVSTAHQDFGSAMILDSDFVLPKQLVDVLVEGTYQPPEPSKPGKPSAAELDRPDPVRFLVLGNRPEEQGTTGEQGKRPVLLDKSFEVHRERSIRANEDGSFTILKGDKTPFPLRAEFAHGGPFSRYNKRGAGLQRIAPGDEPASLARMMPAGVERYEQDEDAPSVGFTALEKTDHRRAEFYGTTDDKWQRHRMPRPPEDFNARYHNCAPPDQQIAHEFVGGEQFGFFGFQDPPDIPVRRSGQFSFVFPHLNFQAYVKETKRPQSDEEIREAVAEGEYKTRLWLKRFRPDTIVANLGDGTVQIVWRLPLPKFDFATSTVTLIVFEEAQKPQVEPLLAAEPTAEAPPEEAAMLENLLAVKEMAQALGGQKPASLQSLASLLQNQSLAQATKLLDQARSNPAVLQSGIRIPAIDEIRSVVENGQDINAFLKGLGIKS